MNSELVGAIISNARNQQNLTVEALANYAGITKSKLVRIESGDFICNNFTVIEKLFDELGYCEIGQERLDSYDESLKNILLEYYNRIIQSDVNFSDLYKSIDELIITSEDLIRAFPRFKLIEYIKMIVFNCSGNISKYELNLEKYIDTLSLYEKSIYYDTKCFRYLSDNKPNESLMCLELALETTNDEGILSLIYYHLGIVYNVLGLNYKSSEYLSFRKL